MNKYMFLFKKDGKKYEYYVELPFQPTVGCIIPAALEGFDWFEIQGIIFDTCIISESIDMSESERHPYGIFPCLLCKGIKGCR